MPELIDYASAILSASEKNLQANALNLANVSTPGFKRQAAFSDILRQCGDAPACVAETVLQFDFRQGNLSQTGQPLDLGIYGPGLLQLRDEDRLVYTRGGSFRIVEDGKLADADGRVLQQQGGGDLTIAGTQPTILGDGTVLENGVPRARIALVEVPDPTALKAAGGSTFSVGSERLEDAEKSSIRQGFLESSNVTTSDEMVSMMASVRHAESGGRLAQFYDQLMGHVNNGLAQSSEAAAHYSYRHRIERERMRSLQDGQGSAEEDSLSMLARLSAGLAFGLLLESEPDLEEIADPAPSAYESLAWNQLVARVHATLDSLPEREAYVIREHYRNDVSFQQIAAILGVTKGRVSQIHRAALQRLRSLLAKHL